MLRVSETMELSWIGTLLVIAIAIAIALALAWIPMRALVVTIAKNVRAWVERRRRDRRTAPRGGDRRSEPPPELATGDPNPSGRKE